MNSMEFRRWLFIQTGRSDDIGDLAVCIQRDTEFPHSAKSALAIERYMKSKGVGEYALVVLARAYDEYKELMQCFDDGAVARPAYPTHVITPEHSRKS